MTPENAVPQPLSRAMDLMDTNLRHPVPDSVVDLFDRALGANPNGVAVTGDDGDFSYQELDQVAWWVHDALLAAGVRPGTRVGLLGERGAAFPAVVLATFRAGAVLVPLDVSWPATRLSHTAAAGRVGLVLVTGSAGARIARELSIATLDVASATARTQPAGAVRTRDRHLTVAGSAAYVMYTSGTTGEPKGVLTSHGALVRLAERLSTRFQLDNTSRVLQFHPATIDISLEELVVAWAVGGSTVTVSDATRTDLLEFTRHLKRFGVTVLDLPTSFWLVWLEAIERGDVPLPGPPLRCVGVGSEPVPEHAVELWIALGAPAEFYNLYGSTETGVTTIVDGPVHLFEGAEAGAMSSIIGTPMDGVTSYILDAELRPVPTGVRGQLHLSGDIAALGYDGDPRATARTFVPDPFSKLPGRRMFAMGDEVSERHDGRLEFHGRIDSQLLVHGFTVHPSTIEDIITAVPGVASARVHGDHSDTVTRLIADLALEQHDNGVVQAWNEVYDALYTSDSTAHRADLDTTAWLSSIDGSPMPIDVMERWRHDIVTKLRAETPRRVLELGCGTGMLLHGIADSINRYIGVDFSAPALDTLRAGTAGRWPDLELDLVQADMASAIMSLDEKFDLVVLNSVVQHLPDAGELTQILTRVSELVAPGGIIVLGDIRNLDLDEDYRLWLTTHPDVSAQGGRTTGESELLLSPRYFSTMPELGGRALTADITSKYIDDDSEMTLFRFDVVLRLDEAAERPADDDVLFTGLSPERLPGADLRQLVLPRRPLVIRDSVRAAAAERGPREIRIGELRRKLSGNGLRLEATPSGRSRRGLDLVVFHPEDERLALRVLRELRAPDASARTANDPRAVLEQQLVVAVDGAVRAHLRAHERPTRYRVLRGDRFVDVALERTLTADRVEPEAGDPTGITSLEHEIAAIWGLVLGQAPGPTDDFFDLGGNSLNLARVLVRMRKAFGVDLSAQELFDAPTVRGIATVVAGRRTSAATAHSPQPVEVGIEITGPASFAQERLWFLDQLNPNSRAYNAPFAFEVDGPLDAEALRAAARAVASRHPVLRTSITMRGGQVVQSITDRDADVREIVAPPLEDTPAPGELSAAERSFVAQAFSLGIGDVFRIGWTRLSSARHRLLFVMHHVAVDELSLVPLFGDFATEYRAASTGITPARTVARARYLDYARWERSSKAEADRARERHFWREYLAGASTVARFPVDRRRPALQTGRGRRHEIRVSTAVGFRVNAALRRDGLTPYQFWLGIYSLFLSREFGEGDVLVGVPSANRPLDEMEREVGFFVNTLPVRLDLGANPTVTEHLAATARSLRAAQAHEGLPLQEIVEATDAHRDVGFNPLFQTMVVLEPSDDLCLDLGASRAIAIDEPESTSTVDLSLVVRSTPEAPTLRFVYNPDLFSGADLERMAETFLALLDVALDDPDRRVGDPIPASPQHASVLRGSVVDHDDLLPVHRAVAETARRFPKRTAVFMGDKTWDYATLVAESNRVAAFLLDATGGALPPFVPVLMEGSPLLIATMLAVNRLGSAFVPVAPDWPAVRVRHILDDLDSPVYVTDSSASTEAGSRRAIDVSRTQAPQHEPLKDVLVDLATPMYAMYTSGSTGAPKAAIVHHGGIANRLAWMTREFGEAASHRVLQTTPPSFDSSVWEYFWPLVNGGATVLSAPTLQTDPQALSKVIARHRITTIDMVPGLFLGLLKHVSVDLLAREEVSTLVVAVVGGEELTPGLATLVEEVGLDVEVYNLYGPTEASIGSVFHRLTALSGARVPIGRPIDGTTAFVLDDSFTPVPRGVRGELFLGGACVGLGYVGKTAEMRSNFVDVAGEGRLYRTGDMARVRNDGMLDFLGRRDHQFNVTGVRVEAGEIVNSLVSIAGIAEAGVLNLDVAEIDHHQLLAELAIDAYASDEPDRRTAVDAVLTLLEQER